MSVLALSGNPSPASRTEWLLEDFNTTLEAWGFETGLLPVSSLPPHAVLGLDTGEPGVKAALARVAGARVIVIGTPIYKASFSGLLKAFLDLLPQNALAGKIVQPVATGGSPAHLLAIDYALRPVLQALGAEMVLPGVFASDRQVRRDEAGAVLIDDDVSDRLEAAAERIESLYAGLSPGLLNPPPIRWADPARAVAA